MLKTINKILIFLLLSVALFGCAVSKQTQTSNTIEISATDDFKTDDSAADDSATEIADAAQSSESDTGTENEPVYDEEVETDPFGTPIWSVGVESYFPLYDMIKEEDIYLYGVHDCGMILYQDGKGTYFDWPGLTPRNNPPKIVYYDFDGDNKKELAVSLYVGSGTGFAVMDLHILEIEKEDESGEPLYTEYWGKPVYTDYALLNEDIDKWMREPITATLSEDKKTIMVEICGDKYEIEAWSESTFVGIVYGSIVYFSFEDNQIKVEIGIGVYYDESPGIPQYFGTVNANVNFDGEKIFLEDYTFSLLDEY